MTQPQINWYLISNAISFYKNLGYKYIEVPWHVSNKANLITAPKNKNILRTVYGGLDYIYGYPIGSAEQGFLHLLLEGNLPKGRYVTCSPCFRNEEPNDGFHFNQFMKVELFVYNDEIIEEFHKMINNAECLFTHYVDCELMIMSNDEEGFTTAIDIVTVNSNIELGSYGIGSYENYKWVYGTGLAEPRLSQAKNI